MCGGRWGRGWWWESMEPGRVLPQPGSGEPRGPTWQHSSGLGAAWGPDCRGDSRGGTSWAAVAGTRPMMKWWHWECSGSGYFKKQRDFLVSWLWDVRWREKSKIWDLRSWTWWWEAEGGSNLGEKIGQGSGCRYKLGLSHGETHGSVLNGNDMNMTQSWIEYGNNWEKS